MDIDDGNYPAPMGIDDDDSGELTRIPSPEADWGYLFLLAHPTSIYPAYDTGR